MRPTPLVAIFGFAVLATAAEPPVLVPPAEPAPLLATKAVRRISPETAARLAATSPTFAPPPAPAATPAVPVDLREVDRPRNQIIRLPAYRVEAPKVPELKERHILRPRAKLDLVFQRNPGLRVGNFFGLNGGIAAAMLADEERLERMREFNDLVSLLNFSEPPASPELRQTLDTTFMRPAKFGR